MNANEWLRARAADPVQWVGSAEKIRSPAADPRPETDPTPAPDPSPAPDPKPPAGPQGPPEVPGVIPPRPTPGV